MKTNQFFKNVAYLGFFSLVTGILSCSKTPDVTSTPKGSPGPKVIPLIQSPELSGDFGSQNQLSSVDKVFTFTKEAQEETSENTSVVLMTGSNGQGFKVVSSLGCNRPLAQREKCFVRVRFEGKQYVGENAGEKSATLQVGSLNIPLIASYDPLENQDLSVLYNSNVLEEKMDIQCLPQDAFNCYLVFTFKNNGIIPLTPSSLRVPDGYEVQYNSCNQSLKAKKSCYVRLKVQDSVEDLETGELLINVNGQDLSREVRVLREEDSEAPQVSLSVLNALEINQELFVSDSEANVRLFLADNRLAKGLFYTVSSDLACSSSSWVSTNQAENLVSFLMTPQTNKLISVKAKDMVGNQSACIPLTIRTLDQLNYSLSLTQPLLGLSISSGLSSSASSVGYNQSFTITYTPPVGTELVSWTGDCLGSSGNECLISNVTSDKSASAVVQCIIGYENVAGICVESVYSLTLNQPSLGLFTSTGLSSSSNTVNYGQSFVITYSPPTGTHLTSWTGDCAGTVGNICTLSNVTSHKSVSLQADCDVGYSNNAGVCTLLTYNVVLNQPVGSGLASNGSATVNYGSSRTITYTPPSGFERVSWTGDCASIGSGNTCVLSNIQSNKTVGINVQCQVGYTLTGNACVLNTYSVSITQPTLGSGTSSGISTSASTVNYNGSATITYTPPAGVQRIAWTGDCSFEASNVCVLNNITSNKSVSATVECQVGYTLTGSSCVLNTYSVTLTQPSGNGLSSSGSATVNYGDSRTITYTPPTGYKLVSWGGSCAGIGSGNTCVLSSITSNKTVSVSIELLPYDAITTLAYGSLTSAQMDNCVATTLVIKDITGGNINRTSSSVVPLTFSAGLQAYSDAGCGTAINSITIPASGNSVGVYLKNAASTQGSYNLNYDFTSFVAGRTKTQSITYNRPLDCRDAFAKGYSGSAGVQNTGAYTIDPDGNTATLPPFSVICEMGNSSWRAQQSRGLTLVAAYRMSSPSLSSVEGMSSVPSASSYLSDSKYSGLLNNIGASTGRYVIITTSSASNNFCTSRINTNDVLRTDGRRLTTLQNNTSIRPGNFGSTNSYKSSLSTGDHNVFFHKYEGDSGRYTGYSYHGNGNSYLYVGAPTLYNTQPLTIWNGSSFVADNGTTNAYSCGHSNDWLYIYIN